MTGLPAAVVRTQVTVPVALDEGATVAARVVSFEGLIDGREHLAVGFGAALDEPDAGPVLVRLHSECLTGDVLGSQRCDCGPQLRDALQRLRSEGGWLLYLRQEGRGIGLYAKLDAYVLQDAGLDTYDANLALGHREDERDYTVAAQMLRALGLERVALLTNNPDKIAQLEARGLTVEARVPSPLHLSSDNARYLAAKASRGSHLLDLSLGEPSAS